MRPPEIIPPPHFTNWMPFVLVEKPDGFTVESKRTPRTAIAMVTAVIGLFSVGFAVLGYYMSDSRLAAAIFVTIGILTTVGTPILIALHFQHEQRLGPVLAFDADKKMLRLPRLPTQLTVSEVDCCCLVFGTHNDSDWYAQLQLHTIRGERHLLMTAYTRKELEPILHGIVTRIPVRGCCYTEDRNNWRDDPFPPA